VTVNGRTSQSTIPRWTDEQLSRRLALVETQMDNTEVTDPNWRVLETIRCLIEEEQARRAGRDE